MRQVSCFITVLSGTVRYVALESYRPTDSAPFVRTFMTTAGTGAGYHTTTAAATHLAAASHKLKVNVFGEEFFSLECSVVGDLLGA